MAVWIDFAGNFSRNPDGSWTCKRPGSFDGPTGRIQVTRGSTFYPGTKFMGFDLAVWLEGQMSLAGVSFPRGRTPERRRSERRGARPR